MIRLVGACVIAVFIYIGVSMLFPVILYPFANGQANVLWDIGVFAAIVMGLVRVSK